MYKVYYTKQAVKDLEKLKQAGLSAKAKKLFEIIKKNPFQSPPPYEKLVGDLTGFFSRRINIQHRLVYEVLEHENAIKIVRMWTHYER
jgi:toxin YoeB